MDDTKNTALSQSGDNTSSPLTPSSNPAGSPPSFHSDIDVPPPPADSTSGLGAPAPASPMGGPFSPPVVHEELPEPTPAPLMPEPAHEAPVTHPPVDEHPVVEASASPISAPAGGFGGLPPVITPPQKKGKGKMFAALAGIVLLLVSIPVGVILVRQNLELREKAADFVDDGGASCSDDQEYCDNGRKIHKHGGYWDGEQCVYAFDDVGSCDDGGGGGGTPSCNDDQEYCDGNQKIHKHGGYWDGSQCVYAFDNVGTCGTGTVAQSCTPVITFGNDQPVIESSPAMDCSTRASVGISMTITVPAGCAPQTVTWKEYKPECSGQAQAQCGGTCAGTALTPVPAVVSAGSPKTVNISCTVPNACGSCQVDYDTISAAPGVSHGAKAVMTSGCGPMACVAIKVYKYPYDAQYLVSNVNSLKPGDAVKFCVAATGGGTPLIKINGGADRSATENGPDGTKCLQYDIPGDATTLRVTGSI